MPTTTANPPRAEGPAAACRRLTEALRTVSNTSLPEVAERLLELRRHLTELMAFPELYATAARGAISVLGPYRVRVSGTLCGSG